MNHLSSLKNHLLIAMPDLSGTDFEQSVIFVCDHKEEGAVGLMINRPMPHQLGLIFDQLKIQPNNPQIGNRPLLYGGPLQPERGFVLHKQMENHWRSSMLLNSDVTVTTSNDIISAIAEQKGPSDLIITMGFLGWDEKQLEDEIIHDKWLVCPMHSEIIYEIPFKERWQYAASLLGVNMLNLSNTGGHA